MRQAEALEKGRDVTRQRAAFKRHIRESDQPKADLARALDDLPDWLRSMGILDYLCVAPNVGSERALAMLERADPGLSPFRTVGELTDRQRGVLAHVLTTPLR